MNVLVTGATGFVGQEVVRQLHVAGHSTRILARDPGSRRVRELTSLYSAGVHPGDVLAAGSLDGALSGIDAVIHLVGIISEAGESTFENVHVRGTDNLVTAAQKGGVRRFVHMSALGTRSNAVARYHQTKWAAEELVRQSGLNYTIFRPSLVFGRQDHFVNLFARMIRLSPVLPVMGSTEARFQPVAVEAVGQAFARSLTESRAIGQTYDLCGPETLTFPGILDEILRAMGRRRLKLRMPSVLARLQALALEFAFCRLLRTASPFTRDQLVMLREDNVGNGQPSNELFGLEQIGFKEGIRAYVKPQSRTP